MVKRNIFRAALLISLMIIHAVTIFSQNSLDDLNVILKQDFENNTVGNYNLSEWEKDWSYPEWCNRQSELDISQDPNDTDNPSKLLQIYYPANSLGPEEGGTNWWTGLNAKYNEMYVSYDIMFMPGFQYQKGGKLPSIKGGSVETLGDFNRPDGYDGFAAGMMFKEDGRLVFYIYYPDSKVDVYGETFTWGLSNYPAEYFYPSKVKFGYAKGEASYATPGVWHNITYRTVLNTVNSDGNGNLDGILEAYFDGELVLQITNLLWRQTNNLGIDCFRTVTFFGGSADEWRNPISEWLKVDNILLYTYKDQMDVPRGNELSPSNRVINYWRNFGKVPAVDPPESNALPNIQDQEFLIKENLFKDNFIGKVSAYDTDPDQTLTYSIISGNLSGIFKVDSRTGELTTTTAKLFDFSLTEYNLVVQATDNGTPAKSATATINVKFLANTSEVYINPSVMADPNEDGTIAHPFNSWGDISWKDGNTYLQKRGTIATETNIVIGANNVTLDSYGEGELPVIASETNGYLISGFERSNITIHNLHLKSPEALSCLYFLGNTSENIDVENCRLEGYENSIRAMECQSVIFKYNTISAQNEGIYSTALRNEIYYNVFKDNLHSLNIVGTNSKANIFNNVFVNNGKAIVASYAEMNLYNNIFYFTDGTQKAISYNADKMTSDNNIFYPEQAGFIDISGQQFSTLDQIRQQTDLDVHSLTADPQFTDVYNDDFSLSSNSPAVNAGINLNLDVDFYGQPVPYAGLPDIGIAEFTGDISGPKGLPDPELVLYPNPSTGYVNVDADFTNTSSEQTVNAQKSSSSSNPSELKVMDMNGKMVFSKMIESTESIFHENIDLSGKMNGLYFIILKIADKTISSKITINR
jgi:hypothetical protein